MYPSSTEQTNLDTVPFKETVKTYILFFLIWNQTDVSQRHLRQGTSQSRPNKELTIQEVLTQWWSRKNVWWKLNFKKYFSIEEVTRHAI